MGDVYSLLQLKNCHALTSLTLGMIFQCHPWSNMPHNSAIMEVISYIFSTAPVCLRKLTFAVLLDGKAKDINDLTTPFAKELDATFSWLETVDTTHPHLTEVTWVWRTPRSAWLPVDQRPFLPVAMTGVVRSKFKRLDGKGVLRFSNTEEVSHWI